MVAATRDVRQALKRVASLAIQARTRSRRTTMSATSLSRLAFGALLLLPAAGAAAQGRPPAVQQMVKAFGIDSFGKVDGIRYTWNADTPNGTISRKWEWNPKTDTVSYEGKDKQGKP